MDQQKLTNQQRFINLYKIKIFERLLQRKVCNSLFCIIENLLKDKFLDIRKKGGFCRKKEIREGQVLT